MAKHTGRLKALEDSYMWRSVALRCEADPLVGLPTCAQPLPRFASVLPLPLPHSASTMGFASGVYTFFCLLMSILLPPLGVIMRTGVCNKDVAINILLTILGYVPGIIHALWIFATVTSVGGEGHHHTL